ncbi:Uma2 family endonuclease [Oxynema aestuarii]|uniref:Uma2 family endonuclease n=1 Tax=Oxynema aestuarii AP17 TaxID=2064643 RepID=A0A6H1U3J2_9CYAN|nr:Uma2 family endonuclease [Oxynema aestuarii]QIZ72189.1 Uma2 family endonuclease [Oxynema aestuarii AP17]RMH71383.1 MAG: Uma2 family endonuclease [Cyanobacteria bacterium J007]
MLNTVILNVENIGFTDAQFYQLCLDNQDLQLERTAKGELVIMPPVGGISGGREADLIGLLWVWNRQSQLGKVFSSNTLFRLPEGGDRSPDAAWVSLEKWEGLTEEEKAGFPPICPEFVIEVRSRSDSLKPLQEKMLEYLQSGLQLGWLIDPQNQQVEIYRPHTTVEVRSFPVSLSGESVLPGFTVELLE